MGFLRKLLGIEVTTDALDLLTAQHEEIDQLFEAIEQGKDHRRALFTELADKLAAHAAVEEKVFYPVIMTDDTADMLKESVEEHLAMKRLLADLIAMRSDDEQFAAKLKVLKEQHTHHAHEEEEDKLFPRVRSMLSIDERAALGNELLVMFEDLMQAHPYQDVPAETAAAAQLPPVR